MIIASNWKAYVTDFDKAKKLVAVAKKHARKKEQTIVLAPPASFMSALAVGNKSKVAFAAQDVSIATGGAHTGENTASMYASAGATYAIAGHSERRAAGDTNTTVTEKLTHILARGISPILCIGEHEHDPEGRYLSFIREQLTAAFSTFTPKERSRFTIAYEPIWAIGKSAGDAITPDKLTEMVLYIRKILGELLPGKGGARIPILYGGSVEPGNIRDLARATGVDGFLIGHAAAEEKSFDALLKALS